MRASLDDRPARTGPLFRLSRLVARAARGALPPVLAALLAGALACRRSEGPSGGPSDSPPSGAGKAAPATPATADREPVIRESAETGKPPFRGIRAARDAAVDDRGRIWVTDFEHSAIRLFDPAGGSLGGWGTRGDGRHQVKDACGIAVRGDSVYVADTWNGRVTRFSLAGAWQGKAPGDFYGPRGVAVAPDGRVWIADTGNGRIVVCEKDLSNPRYYGKKGDGPDQFSSPVGIAAGPSGRIYIADSVNGRVQVLEPDGRGRSRFPVRGWGPNTEPYLEVDDSETIYATDPAGQTVVALDSGGRERKRWTEDDAGRRFARPTGIALDRKKRVLYVVNTDNDVVSTLKLP